MCLPACLSVCQSLCLLVGLSVCLPVSLSICLSVCLPTCLSVWLSISLSARQLVCLPVSWSVCLSVCLSVSVSVYLSSYRYRSLRTTPDHWLKIKHLYVFGFSVFQLFLFGYLWSFNSHVFVRFAWEEITSADTCKTRVVPDGCYYKGSDSCNYIFLYVLNSALPINMCYCQKWKDDISISCKPFF